jgi:hypothetical protein
MMKRIALLIAVLAFGFVLKVGIAEAERLTAFRYIEQCFQENKPTTDEGKTECYGAARKHALYRFIAILNAQPALWKNTKGRCVGTEGTQTETYFECSWWNRFAV